MKSRRKLSWSGRIVIASAATSVVSFVLLHAWMSDVVDPMRRPVSLYALDAPGTVLFPLGVLGVAVASAALAAVKQPRGPRTRWGVRACMGTTAGMLTAVVVFPTDSGYQVTSWAGEVHRYAAGIAFFLLTAVGVVHASRHSGESGRHTKAMRIVVGVSASTFVVIVIHTFAPAALNSQAWSGIPQRILLVAHTVMVMLLGLSLRAPKQAHTEPAPNAMTRNAAASPIHIAGVPSAPILRLNRAPARPADMYTSGPNMHLLSGTDNR